MNEGLFSRLNTAYQENIGQPFVRSPMGQAAAGFFGIESQGTNPEAYKTGQAVGNMPGPNMVSGAVKGAMKAPEALQAAGDAAGTLGLFFGSKALRNGVRAADVIQAEQLLKNGATPNEVYAQSGGLFKGPDGQWRKNIDDTKYFPQFEANLVNASKMSGGVPYGEFAITNLFPHKELYEAYPELKNIKVVFDSTLPAGRMGEYNTSKGIFRLNPNQDSRSMYTTLLHETQHGIQKMEGWQGGGNANNMMPQNVKDAQISGEKAKERILSRITDYTKANTDVKREDIVQAVQFLGLSQNGLKESVTPAMQKSFFKLELLLGII